MSTAARLTQNVAGVLSLLLPLLAVPLPAQNRDVPVIRTTTRLVQLNVVVLDNLRRPVGDLSQDDFEVFDNGREQKLSHFSAVSASAARSAAPSLVLTNRPGQPSEAPGTVTIVLVDEVLAQDAQASYYRAALQSARLDVLKFLRTLPPGQQVALYALGLEGVVVIHDLTDDSAALLAAAKTIGGGQLKAKISPVGAKPDTPGTFASATRLTARKTDLTEDLRRELVKEAFQGIAQHL